MVIYFVWKLPSLSLLLGLILDAVVGVGGGRGYILSEMKLTVTVNTQNRRREFGYRNNCVVTTCLVLIVKTFKISHRLSTLDGFHRGDVLGKLCGKCTGCSL